MIWHCRYEASSGKQIVWQDPTWKVKLNHISIQKPSHINCTNASRDFGPMNTELSKIHVGILVPGLQLLNHFSPFTIYIDLTFLQEDFYILPNMAGMAQCPPKIPIPPFIVCNCCQQQMPSQGSYSLVILPQVLSCAWLSLNRRMNVTSSQVLQEATVPSPSSHSPFASWMKRTVQT